jgi:aldehyde dehydrogenase (NAD+)
MPETFSTQWNTPVYKGATSFSTGLFINGEFVDGVKKTTIEYALLLYPCNPI